MYVLTSLVTYHLVRTFCLFGLEFFPAVSNKTQNSFKLILELWLFLVFVLGHLVLL